MIKVEHTLFAMPFAFTGMFLATEGEIPSFMTMFWIFVAVFGARSGAMGFNRVADYKIDAKNPRTAGRDIPAGRLSVQAAWAYVIVSFAVYGFAAYMLNPLCLYLSPVPVAVFVLYAYTKRFTALCHLVLGVALALAPIGAWIAIRGTFDLGIAALGAGVLVWVAGFDIVYACQDLEFDREEGLHSIPAMIGLRNSLTLARVLHVVAFALFFFVKLHFGLGWLYGSGLALSGAFMIYQHAVLKPQDLSKLGMAFFNLNAYISITLFVSTLLDLVIL